MFDQGSTSDQGYCFLPNRPHLMNPSLGYGGILFNAMFPFDYLFHVFLGRGRGVSNTGRGRLNNIGNRPTYQLCGKQGHTITNCWYRFDPTYQP